ncbi:hypothetical protein V6N11_044327 [Hibiscus sabdariffa]|uniref:Uncharacterized protein n=1 Tax=Hibiscus sabdariffa TaxID=183260 RepID=A0ABR2RF82_9ROSI
MLSVEKLWRPASRMTKIPKNTHGQHARECMQIKRKRRDVEDNLCPFNTPSIMFFSQGVKMPSALYPEQHLVCKSVDAHPS